jgi:trehalose 6-phosphate phosphatase
MLNDSTPSSSASAEQTPATPNWSTQTELFRPVFEASRSGLITDVDGVISPIVERPEDAYITPRSLELLAALVQHLPVVGVISGRSAADVHQRVGIDGLEYVGNHGLERWAGDHVEVTPSVAPYRPALVAAIEELEKHHRAQPELLHHMQIEDKGATLTVHYRRVAQPEAAHDYLDPILNEIALRQEIELFPGRMIFELRPPIPMNKGTAFEALIKNHQLDAAIYIGDDTTDADAMRVARSLRASSECYAVGVGVLSEDTPSVVLEAADVFASSISDVESFFEWLLNQFSASSS